MTTLAVNCISSGNNTVVPLNGNNGIVIRRIFIQANALSTVKFRAGSSDITGPMTFTTGGSMGVDGDPVSNLVWVVEDDFVVNLSGLGANVGGWLEYDYY